jgi:hypothetical protein
MKITRDVITDLLPVYLAGEASPDTRALIDEFLDENPDFAKLVAEQEKPLTSTSINIPKETEMQTLEKTKKILWQRSMYMGFAIFFSLFPASVRGSSDEGIRWMWEGTPIIPIVSVLIAILMWILYARTNHKLDGSEL